MIFDEQRFLRLIRGETRGAAASFGRSALTAASWAYALAASSRNLAFDRGLKKTTRAEVPVVSIGNITLGGTGKTPMVEHVARWYQSRDLRVAILSRGYGGENGLNDEGLVLQHNLPDTPHLQGRDRVASAQKAINDFQAQLLVLDDGFQHRRLARDLDIVLLDALSPFGLDRLFPRGLLREPISALKRAQLVVLSRADFISRAERAAIRTRVEHVAGRRPWVEARQSPLDLIDADGRLEPLESTRGPRVAAFCGIGNPEGFRKTLESLGVDLVGLRAFPDHHPYSSSDADALATWAGSLSSELLLTTQKDLVKLRAARIGASPLRALRIGFEPLDDPSPLETALAKLLPRAQKSP